MNRTVKIRNLYLAGLRSIRKYFLSSFFVLTVLSSSELWHGALNFIRIFRRILPIFLFAGRLL